MTEYYREFLSIVLVNAMNIFPIFLSFDTYVFRNSTFLNECILKVELESNIINVHVLNASKRSQ